jgi:hypothetical protein
VSRLSRRVLRSLVGDFCSVNLFFALCAPLFGRIFLSRESAFCARESFFGLRFVVRESVCGAACFCLRDC